MPLADVGRYSGHFLTDVAVLTAANVAGTVRITMTAGREGGTEVKLTRHDIRHLRMDTAASWDDFVDELTAVQSHAFKVEGWWLRRGRFRFRGTRAGSR
jgi:hypothetical protein